MRDHDVPGRTSEGGLWLGTLLILIAVNLRPVFSSLPAILPEVMRDLVISAFAAGLLTTLPVVCLGVFAPFAPRLSARIGAERALLLVLAGIALGSALRGVPRYPVILAGSALAGVAIAIGNVLMPGLIKRDFPGRVALMTGLYTMGIAGGGALGAGLTVPVAAALGGRWPLALAAWALFAGAVAVLWLPACLGPAHRFGSRRGAGPLWRNPLAWRVTLFMGLQSALAYCVYGWMAPILRERGLDAATAGYLVAASVVSQVVASVATPWFATRGRDQRLTCFVLLASSLVGLLGALFGPLPTVGAFVMLQGVGQGGLLAAAMLIIILRAPNAETAASLSGMAQSVGYVVAACGPLLVGIIRSAAGSFAPTAWLYLALAAGAGWAASRAGRLGLVPDIATAPSRPVPPRRAEAAPEVEAAP